MGDGGVKLRHPHLRNVTLLVENYERPYKIKTMCTPCKTEHHVKTYHFKLDNEGCVIVSHDILVQLEKMPGRGGLEPVTDVKNPPDQHVNVNTPPQLVLAR